jgi:hypothetical protein
MNCRWDESINLIPGNFEEEEIEVVDAYVRFILNSRDRGFHCLSTIGLVLFLWFNNRKQIKERI